MDLTTFTKLGWKHAVNHVKEELYLRTGRDVTRPVTFIGCVNEHCNVKCRYCEFWRLKSYVDEMSIDEWKAALLSIRDFVGRYSISFSGGEPFIKKGFVDLMVWCHENGIHSGVVTNGSALSRKIVERLVQAHPFNVNVSVDAPHAELHDYLRGDPGLHDTLRQGITWLREERDRRGLDFPIIVKPTVNRLNFRHLPEMVGWALGIGATNINFQPMDRWTPETYNELWVEEPDLAELGQVMERLVGLKNDGAPILTSESVLRLFPAHFRGEKAPPEAMPCRVGLRDFFIRTNGNVEVCWFYPPIGNIKEQSARDLWYGTKAQEIRRQTVACDRLCLFACLSQKTLRDKARIGWNLLRGRRRARATPG